MNTRAKLFWLVWLIVVIAVLWWFAKAASGASYIHVQRNALHSPKGEEQDVPTRIAMPGLPAIPVMPADVFYFAVTAFAGALESEFSNEISFTNLGNGNTASLAWDASSPGVDGYRVHKGWYSGVYDTTFNSTTNLSQTVWLYQPVRSNLVIVVTSQNATNLQWSTGIGKPWTLLGGTNWSATNASPRIWRGVGKSQVNRPKVFITGGWK